MMSLKCYDDVEGYCPRLGHHLTFQYCREANGGDPCSKVFDCWHETFPVMDFFQGQCSEEEIRSILAPGKSKLTCILEEIIKARNLKKE